LTFATPFWVDTNVFIEAKNRWYRFEMVPKFWAFLSAEIEAGSICCPKYVYDELVKGKDQLADWIRARKSKGLCIAADREVQAEFRKIAAYVSVKFPRNQYEEFLSGADPWVVASAMRFGGTVVTQESISRKRKIRIPTICSVFSVPWVDTPGMLDHFKPTF